MKKHEALADNLGGFPDYPNLYLDRQAVDSVVEWDDDRHNWKTAQYREYMRREGLLPRHRAMGQLILDRLEFDGDCRDGVYDPIPDDIGPLVDELCGGA